jgi:Ser/Thr protein kinase RdoA (MazF antagonist)
VTGDLAALLGGPVVLDELKHKPGRRRTWRATGTRRSAIVKVYASGRAATVAGRIAALEGGPASPEVPRVLLVDVDAHMLVLSEVPGPPLREAVLAGDFAACRLAGAAVGAWHRWWADALLLATGTNPMPLRPHTAERELETLTARAADVPPSIRDGVLALADGLSEPWSCSTVIHRDLYEEQVMVAPGGRVGLIDLDDAGLGPPELDLGNLLAHLDLLGLRSGVATAPAAGAIVDGYTRAGPAPDAGLLDRCRRLTLLRLACIHREQSLLDAAAAATRHAHSPNAERIEAAVFACPSSSEMPSSSSVVRSSE